MNIPKKAVLAAICFILLVFSGAPNAKAAAVDDAVEIFKECPVYSFNMDSIKDDHIIVTWKYSNNYTTDSDHGNYTNPFIDIEGFEIQVCTDKTYPEDKVITYTTADYVENVQSAEYTYKIPVSILGKNGGKLYARIRAYGKVKTIEGILSSDEPTNIRVGDVVYGNYQNLTCWGGWYIQTNYEEKMERDYCEYVKITKDNWGGMYSLIKSGYYYCDSNGVKSYYDPNRDGWLDPSEIFNIHTIFNYKYGKSPSTHNYELLFKTNTYQCKISDLDGLQFLPWVSAIQIRDYTAKKLDLSQYGHIRSVSIRELWQSKLQLIAPYAKEISIESETGGSWNKAKLSSVDVSKCSAVVHLTLGGSYYKYITAKLPASAQNLRWISLSYSKDGTVNLNKYKNLNLAYFYANKFTKCKMEQCTKLDYVYFYCSDQIASVNLKNAKSLKGVDIYACKKLTSSGVQTVKKTKITKNKGRWWETSKSFKKIVDNIYESIYESM